MNTKVQTAIRYSYIQHTQTTEHEPTKLKINHLAGAFALLAFGLFLAITIFTIELLAKKF